MEGDVRRTVVVSAVNLRKGGTLTILRQCLQYLSEHLDGLRVVALVHKRELCEYPGIEYIEMPWCIKSWWHRLWAEYVTMHKISRQIAEQDGRKVWTWLSLHDTTPRVEAEHREVYCHTSFPFLKVKLHDWVMDPKVPLFALFTKWAYRINVHKNDCLIVQQDWFADDLSELLGFPREKIRVISPAIGEQKQGTIKYFKADNPDALKSLMAQQVASGAREFFYASTPDCHKNFETLCRAAQMLQDEVGKDKFKVIITINGRENRYSRWLWSKWGDVESIDFHGFMSKDELWGHYASADCFVFPSRVETWGLPISEFRSVSDKPLLLADLPYAHNYENSTVR